MKGSSPQSTDCFYRNMYNYYKEGHERDMAKKKKEEDWWDTHLVIDGVDEATAKQIKNKLKKKLEKELTRTNGKTQS